MAYQVLKGEGLRAYEALGAAWALALEESIEQGRPWCVFRDTELVARVDARGMSWATLDHED